MTIMPSTPATTPSDRCPRTERSEGFGQHFRLRDFPFAQAHQGAFNRGQLERVAHGVERLACVAPACLGRRRQDFESGAAGGADDLLVVVAHEQWRRAQNAARVTPLRSSPA